MNSELRHSGILALHTKRKATAANCLCDSFVAGTDEKNFFFLKIFQRTWAIMVGNNLRK